MALIDLKKIRPHWKGTFAANVAYLVNDVVIYSVPFTNQRNIYICTTNSIGNLPSDVNFFDIMVQNVIPLDQMGEIYYYSTSTSPAQNTSISPPNGDAGFEMTGSINSTTHDSKGHFLVSEGEGTNPSWEIPKLNERHTVRKLCKFKYGDVGTPVYVIMDSGEIWTVGGDGSKAGAGEYIGDTYVSLYKPAVSPNFPGALDVISSNAFSFCVDKERKLWHWGRTDAYGSARETTADGWVYVMVRVGTGTTSSDFKSKYVHKFVTGGGQGDDETHHYEVTNACLMTDGTLYTWGDNGTGAVGNGTTSTYQNTPWQISGTWTNVWSFGLNQNTRIFATRLENGVEKLYAWGSNRYGALGVGDTTNRQTPTLVGGDGLLDGEEVGMVWGSDKGQGPDECMNFFQTKTSRRLYVTGTDYEGATGLGTSRGTSNPRLSPEECAWGGNTSATPYLIHMEGPKNYYGGWVANMSDGTVRTWGYGISGHHGINSTSQMHTPVDPLVGQPHLYDSPIIKVQTIAGYYSSWTSHEHGVTTYLLRADGTVWSAGQNQQTQLGQGHNTYADGSSMHWGYVSYQSGTPHQHKRAEWQPSQRYWSVERDGQKNHYNTTSYYMDQEQVNSGGQFRPMYQGLHRFVDICGRHVQTDYTNDEPWYHTCLMVDENGVLCVAGDESYDGNGREMLPEGGLCGSSAPVPVNFP